MKRSVIALSGLAFVFVLGFSTAGCRVTHYGVPAGSVAPAEEAICRATCDRLIEQQAISLNGAKVCLASCTSTRAARPVGGGVAANVAANSANAAAAAAGSTAEAPEPKAEKATAGKATARKRREQNTCVDKDDNRRASAPMTAPKPPVPTTESPAAECAADWDCPEDTACDDGFCR